MDGLSNILNESGIGCSINGFMVNHFMYADDSCVVAPSPVALQRLLDICHEYAQTNTIIYNAIKTKCMCFIPKSKVFHNLHIPDVFISNTKLSFVKSIKYLGVTIVDTLIDDDDMSRHKRYLYSKGNLLSRKFKDCSDKVKSKLFQTFCYNIYCGHLWTSYKPQTLKSVNVAFNDVYRCLFKIRRGMSTIYVKNNLDSFKVLLRKGAVGFRKRLMMSENSIIKTIIGSVYFYNHSSFTVTWAKEIFV